MSGRPGTYRLVMLFVVLTLPVMGWAAFQALQTNANSPLDWVPPSFPARADYEAFRKEFGTGDVVVISWPGCTVEDRRLDLVAKYLRESRNFFNPDYQWKFERVVTGREVFQQLVDAPLNLPVAEARRRLQGSLLGSDGETTCIIAALTPEAMAERRNVVLTIHAVLKACGIPLADQHIAGPVIDGLSVDEAGRQSMSHLVPPSALVVFLVCCWSLRSFRAACLVFLLSVYAQGLTLAMLHLGGETMSALLIVLPPLIQVLAVAGGIHLINYYWDAARKGGDHPAGRAFRVGWLPCVLASATTALGLGSLLVSDLTPIQLFGTYGAAGVLVTLALLLAVLPGTLARWPIPAPASDAGNPHAGDPWPKLTEWIIRYHKAILGLIFAGMLTAGFGLRQLQTSVRIETLFSPESRILRDYRWLEEHVAPLVPIEVVVRFPVNDRWPLSEQLEFVRKIERRVADVEHVQGTLSANTFLPSAKGAREDSFFSAARRHRVLTRALPALIERRYVAETEGEWEWMAGQGLEKPRFRDWRISAHVSAVDPLDYGRILESVREQVNPVLPAGKMRISNRVTARYTGIMPLVHAIQYRLMANLFQSFLMAFGTIAFVMILLQGGILMGLLSMIPNILPAVLLLGGLGWAGVRLDIGSVMTISVGLGIAVDDTLHFLVSYRRNLEAGLTSTAAVRETYEHCGAAMIQTSFTCGLGLLTFAMSDFLPTRRFAWMMLAFLMLALLGDLLLLPALLLSPLGRCFRSSKTTLEPEGIGNGTNEFTTDTDNTDETQITHRGLPFLSPD